MAEDTSSAKSSMQMTIETCNERLLKYPGCLFEDVVDGEIKPRLGTYDDINKKWQFMKFNNVEHFNKFLSKIPKDARLCLVKSEKVNDFVKLFAKYNGNIEMIIGGV